ncbi:endonuclease/exonuclease/phosphatase family protein [Streptomyces sp. NPDC050504]|uniref:endonuclease/exonuclease/phosphatase family protein n=1 Tax=Streptomyces sp. NPDC050504 TaxID=3365618 RepID=UPI0037AB1466
MAGRGDVGNGPDAGRKPGPWRRGRLLAAAAGLCALLMLGHSLVPNGFGNPGSLLETFLPWLGVGVPVLLALAALRRSATAAVAVLVPAVVWCSLFGGMLLDKRAGGTADVTVVSHNVHDANPSPERTARSLAASGAEVIALEELSPKTAPLYERALAATHRYHSVQGTVGLWSTYPLRDVEPLAIMPWTRALRATVDTPKGPLAVYVAHLASVRVLPSSGFATARRDEAAANLTTALRAERLSRVVLVGDFNGTTDDTALHPLTRSSGLRSAQEEAGDGFGFSWPASFPVARIDQVLVKGATPLSSWTLPRTGSDHLPVAASLRM